MLYARAVDTQHQLARAASKAAHWTAERNRLIHQLHTEGASLRAIAAAAGITHTQVANILRKHA